MGDLSRDREVSLDLLAGDWRIYQLRRGHRFSTDDQVTAWRAALAFPGARRVLDLGCGIGSVGLTTLYLLEQEDAALVGVEAQEVSVGLARRTAGFNELEDRVTIVHGDLRDPAVLPPDARFDLVTGSPPYVPIGRGLVSPVPQRAGARIELLGSIFDYCAAARRWLAPGGRFCFVMAAADHRAEDAPARHGFTVLERWDYVFREGRAPHISTLVCARSEEGPHPPRQQGQLLVRDLTGRWTPEYLAFRLLICPSVRAPL
ncbi:MAG: methyltransferase [Deltaproteobacteria bacterium]|nr:methyltransferase [Deltaproteobacteria bacterium]